MTPRPIHQWKTLWLGIIILLCLGWAWRRSYHHFDEANLALASGGPSIKASHGRSEIDLEWRPTYYGNGTYTCFLPVAGGHEWFPSFAYLSWNAEGRIWISAAYWLITLLFLIPWFILLIWRSRKARHLTAQPTAPPP